MTKAKALTASQARTLEIIRSYGREGVSLKYNPIKGLNIASEFSLRKAGLTEYFGDDMVRATEI